MSEPYTGDGVINKLELAGWSSTLASKTTQGRLFWTCASGVVTFYTDELKSTSVMTTTTAATTGVDKALVATNTSGITGTINVSFTADSTGSVIISYATEETLEEHLQNSASYLSTSGSNWPTSTGSNRFERAFRQAKRKLDVWLEGAFASGRGATTTRGRPDLTTLSEPRQLSDVHAQLTAAVILKREASINRDPVVFEQVRLLDKQAHDDFAALTVRWDTSRDGQVDSVTSAFGSFDLARG